MMANTDAPRLPLVLARVRPQFPLPLGACPVAYRVGARHVAIAEEALEGTTRVFDLEVDEVLGEDARLGDVYRRVQPTVMEVMSGYEGAIICYGTSRSGKTYNTFGTEEEEGILPRAIRDLYEGRDNAASVVESIKDRPAKLPPSTITVRVFQIYRDSCFCLTPTKAIELPATKIQSLSLLDKTENYQISGETPDDLLQAIKSARKQQHIGFAGNKSRSHFIYIIETNTVVYEDPEDSNEGGFSMVNGILTITDLAGVSVVNNIKNKDEREDARSNNVSLFNLGRVVEALSQGKSTGALFRSCPLTRILELSLGGTTLLDIILTIRGYDGEQDNEFYRMMYCKTNKERMDDLSNKESNNSSSYNESRRPEELNTLSFGASVKGLKLKPKKDATSLTLEELEVHIDDLKTEYSKLLKEFNDILKEVKNAPDNLYTIIDDYKKRQEDINHLEVEAQQAINSNKEAMDKFYETCDKLRDQETTIEKIKRVKEQGENIKKIKKEIDNKKKKLEEFKYIKIAQTGNLETQIENIQNNIDSLGEEIEEVEKRTQHHQTQLARWIQNENAL